MTRFAWVILLSWGLAACGGAAQSVPTSSAPMLPAGYMRVTFRIAGTLDFSNYRYSIIFNTSGSGLTPEAEAHKTNWAAYSAEIDAGGSGGAEYTQVIQYLKNENPNLPPEAVRLDVTPAQFAFAPNSDGTGSEFAVTFQRSIFGAHSVALSKSWRFNAFSLQSQSLADSMGRCGSCFRSPALPVNVAFDRVVTAQKPRQTIPPAARIVSIAFENNP